MIQEKILENTKQCGITLPENAAEQIAMYDALLREGNTRMNLTRGMDTEDEAIDRHYLDALMPLSVHVFPENMKTLLDVGAGAGIPGILLSIAMPDVHVVLLDSLGKRVDFMNEVIGKLRLNAKALHFRAEEAAKLPKMREQFDCVVSRAVARLNTLAEWTLPFTRVGGRLIAYKGPQVQEEANEAKNAVAILGGGKARVVPVSVPGRDWEHSLFVADKIKATPSTYPRKPGEASRKPL